MLDVILVAFIVIVGGGMCTALWLGMRGRVRDQPEPLPTRTFLHYLSDAAGAAGDRNRSKRESTGEDTAPREDI